MLLRLLCLIMVGVHLSTQDLVTLAPSDGPEKVTETVPTPSEKLKPNIRSLHVTSDIKYRYATTLVSTRVVNPNNQSAEAVFSITLPESAFISGFIMEIKEKVYKAYVKEKEEAKAVYDQAVQAGQFAGHVALDARDSNSFTVSVNIEAHGKVTFNLTYEQLLTRNLGTYSNIININPNQIVEDMWVKVDIEEPTEITDLVVPELQASNDIVEDDVKENTLAKIEMKSPNHKIVTWAPTPEEQKSQNSTGLSGQFIVKYDVDRAQNPQQILVDEGYFVHFFAPENLPKLKKHVVFVLDFSGSMDGRKLEQLKDAMKKILSDLEATDYFSIVVFQSIVEAWSPKKIYTSSDDNLPHWQREENPKQNTTLDQDFVVEASPANIDSALTYLTNYSDLGATNIMGGLRTGLKLVDIGQEKLASDPPQPIGIFLTDGQPNVDIYDTEEIIAKTKPLNTKECPIFSLAFGYGADFNFLRKLSLSNHGFARNIYEAADASAQLKNFYRTVASPLFSNVTFSYLPGQVDNTSSTKKEFPIYFLGSEIVVAGKLDKEATEDNTTIGELSGISTKGIHRYPIIIEKVQKPPAIGHLEKTWAYLTIQQLLDKVDSLDESKEKNETKAKALELALKYEFVTPLTSLVVVKPNETESAVGTEKLKPGSGNNGGFYPSALGGGIGGYSGGIMAAYPMAPPPPSYSVSSMKHASGSSAASSFNYILPPRGPIFTTIKAGAPGSSSYSYPSYIPPSIPAPSGAGPIIVPLSAESDSPPTPGVAKVYLNSINWLQPLLTNQTSTVTIEGKEYHLGLNQTDTSFGDCKVGSEVGECHHIEYCALNVFLDDISEFIPYQCSIPGDYLAVCCPKNVLH